MSYNERQQRMIERIYEDERLHENLTDTTATVLIEWATAQVTDATNDPAQPDDIVEAQVQAIRKAARMATRVADVTSKNIVDHAETFLLEVRSTQASTSVHTPPVDSPSVIPSLSAQKAQAVQPVEHNVDKTIDKRSQTWWRRWKARFRSRRKDV